MFKTKYPTIDQLVVLLSASLQAALQSNLKGLYIFGSLVGGDFDAKTSDIDLLAIVKNSITDSELVRLKDAHDAFALDHPEWDNRIEVAYVSIEGMRHFKTTANQIARISPGEPLHYRSMNIEWLMDWYMVQEQGLTVFGPPAESYIPHITRSEFIQSLKDSLPALAESAKDALWKGYQSYIVMSFCRNLYAIKHGKQVPKFAGARWAAQEYPEWSEFIKRAAGWHGSADKSDSPDTQGQTLSFVEFALKEATS